MDLSAQFRYGNIQLITVNEILLLKLDNLRNKLFQNFEHIIKATPQLLIVYPSKHDPCLTQQSNNLLNLFHLPHLLHPTTHYLSHNLANNNNGYPTLYTLPTIDNFILFKLLNNFQMHIKTLHNFL